MSSRVEFDAWPARDSVTRFSEDILLMDNVLHAGRFSESRPFEAEPHLPAAAQEASDRPHEEGSFASLGVSGSLKHLDSAQIAGAPFRGSGTDVGSPVQVGGRPGPGDLCGE